jgi:hypothetical protein
MAANPAFKCEPALIAVVAPHEASGLRLTIATHGDRHRIFLSQPDGAAVMLALRRESLRLKLKSFTKPITIQQFRETLIEHGFSQDPASTAFPSNISVMVDAYSYSDNGLDMNVRDLTGAGPLAPWIWLRRVRFAGARQDCEKLAKMLPEKSWSKETLCALATAFGLVFMPVTPVFSTGFQMPAGTYTLASVSGRTDSVSGALLVDLEWRSQSSVITFTAQGENPYAFSRDMQEVFGRAFPKLTHDEIHKALAARGMQIVNSKANTPSLNFSSVGKMADAMNSMSKQSSAAAASMGSLKADATSIASLIAAASKAKAGHLEQVKALQQQQQANGLAWGGAGVIASGTAWHPPLSGANPGQIIVDDWDDSLSGLSDEERALLAKHRASKQKKTVSVTIVEEMTPGARLITLDDE